MSTKKTTGTQDDLTQNTSETNNSDFGLKNNNLWVLIFFMIITCLISISATYLIVNGGSILWKEISWVRWIVKQELNVHEYDKVGWKDNYDVVSKAQLIQLNEQIGQIKTYVEQNKDKLPQTDTTNTWTEVKSEEKPSAANNIVEEKNKLEVFLMGYCPYGEIAAKQIPALFKQFAKDNLNFDIHFIAQKTWEWFEAKDFNSLHGVSEAEEDIRQLCIKKEYGVGKLVDYLQVRYENAANNGAVTEWPEAAIKSIKWDTAKIATCVTSWEGGKLLAEDIKIAEKLWVQWSPTWLANAKFQFGWIEWKVIAEEFCKYNPELTSCIEWIRIESNSANPNSTPACN